MTCWSCSRELTAMWARCPHCGALSAANVEAVCRGVASCAVRVLTKLRPGDETREPLWFGRMQDVHIPRQCHPTRHGAALAAFDAAWSAGRRFTRHFLDVPEDVRQWSAPSADEAVGEPDYAKALAETLEQMERQRSEMLNGMPGLPSADEDREPPEVESVSVRWGRCTMRLAEDVGDIKAGDLVTVDEHGRMRRATPMDEAAALFGGGNHGTPEPVDPWCEATATLEREWDQATMLDVFEERPACMDAGPDPQAIVAAWCEKTGARITSGRALFRVTLAAGGGCALALLGGRVVVAAPNGCWLYRNDPFAHFAFRSVSMGVPTHVADAMVALAREALS